MPTNQIFRNHKIKWGGAAPVPFFCFRFDPKLQTGPIAIAAIKNGVHIGNDRLELTMFFNVRLQRVEGGISHHRKKIGGGMGVAVDGGRPDHSR